jgi:hypothetical protein
MELDLNGEGIIQIQQMCGKMKLIKDQWHSNFIFRLLCYFFIISLLVFLTDIIIYRISLSGLPQEDRVMRGILRVFKRQYPYFYPVDSFNRELFFSTDWGVYDTRNKLVISGLIFVDRIEDDNLPSLDDRLLNYKKTFDERNQVWIFIFPSQTKIVLNANSYKINEINIGPSQYQTYIERFIFHQSAQNHDDRMTK